MTYLNGLREGTLLYQFDRHAGVPVFFPREVGPSGLREALEWRRSSGRGVVYSITVMQPKGEAPFNVALITLEEGFRMMSTVISDKPGEIVIGQSVEAAYDELASVPRIIFRPVQ
ncbi:OB-fold domain-containing protein [Paraburkholderia agricolaris]|uniref:Zn-ribbon domain-containing OB-fold protein n=1 Tax=Paraburkholderia agricolaris TaxID=2152888 RepID=UPI0038B84260